MNNSTRRLLTAFAKSAITDPEQQRAALVALAPRKEEQPDKWLTTKAALAFCGISSWKTLRRNELAGVLHPRHLSKRLVRWSRNELERWMFGSAS